MKKARMEHIQDILAKAESAWKAENWQDALNLIDSARDIVHEYESVDMMDLLRMTSMIEEQQYAAYLENGGLLH